MASAKEIPCFSVLAVSLASSHFHSIYVHIVSMLNEGDKLTDPPGISELATGIRAPLNHSLVETLFLLDAPNRLT